MIILIYNSPKDLFPSKILWNLKVIPFNFKKHKYPLINKILLKNSIKIKNKIIFLIILFKNYIINSISHLGFKN